MTDHFLNLHNYFLTVLVLARFSLSIKRRSEAEHLERTTPISDSFLRSMAASAAPSRSLEKAERALAQSHQLTGTSPSCLPDGQVSPDLLFRRHLGNIFLGFILVVDLHANFNKRLNKRKLQQLGFFLIESDNLKQILILSSPGNRWETFSFWKTSLTPPTPLSLPETSILTTSTCTGETNRTKTFIRLKKTFKSPFIKHKLLTGANSC